MRRPALLSQPGALSRLIGNPEEQSSHEGPGSRNHRCTRQASRRGRGTRWRGPRVRARRFRCGGTSAPFRSSLTRSIRRRYPGPLDRGRAHPGRQLDSEPRQAPPRGDADGPTDVPRHDLTRLRDPPRSARRPNDGAAFDFSAAIDVTLPVCRSHNHSSILTSDSRGESSIHRLVSLSSSLTVPSTERHAATVRGGSIRRVGMECS